MATPDFTIKRGDRLPPLTVTLRDAAGAAVPLTGATVRFHMREIGAQEVKVNRPAQVVQPPANGQVSYAWAAGDTDTPGTYYAEFQVTWSDGTVQTFPNVDYLTVQVVADLA